MTARVELVVRPGCEGRPFLHAEEEVPNGLRIFVEFRGSTWPVLSAGDRITLEYADLPVAPGA